MAFRRAVSLLLQIKRSTDHIGLEGAPTPIPSIFQIQTLIVSEILILNIFFVVVVVLASA
jgi:hypothetical protein